MRRLSAKAGSPPGGCPFELAPPLRDDVVPIESARGAADRRAAAVLTESETMRCEAIVIPSRWEVESDDQSLLAGSSGTGRALRRGGSLVPCGSPSFYGVGCLRGQADRGLSPDRELCAQT